MSITITIARSRVEARAGAAVTRSRSRRHSLACSSSDGVVVDGVVGGVGVGVGRRWWRAPAPRCAARGRARGIRVDGTQVDVKVGVDVFGVDAAEDGDDDDDARGVAKGVGG